MFVVLLCYMVLCLLINSEVTLTKVMKMSITLWLELCSKISTVEEGATRIFEGVSHSEGMSLQVFRAP